MRWTDERTGKTHKCGLLGQLRNKHLQRNSTSVREKLVMGRRLHQLHHSAARSADIN